MTRTASVVRLDQNRRHQDRGARRRSHRGQSRGGLETQLLATIASTVSLMEVTSRIQRQAAEALQALAAQDGAGNTVQQLSRIEDAARQHSRVERAILVLTSSHDSRRDGLDRRLWAAETGRSAESGRWPNWLVEPLTARETVVLRLLCGTLPLSEISQELGVSLNTVKSQVRAIYRKLGVSSRHDAVERARESGIL